tara:strand:- start:44 stop:757 length:714 start_codon:yes stop_codon:yes gene_type:complete
MKCLVCIPSKGRPNNIKKFVEPFMKRLCLDYKIFVEPQDLESYNFKNIISLGANNKGLGYSMLQAKKYCTENGYDICFKIDDDVLSIGEIEKDINKILDAFKIKKIGAVVFPYDFEFYAKTKKLFTRVNKRVQTCYLIRTEIFNPQQGVSTFEDFYQFLNIISKGYNTLYCSKHLIKCNAVGSGNGGLQDFDRSEMAIKEINIFKSIDPTIEVISKPNKPWKYEPKFTDKKYRSKQI